MAAFSSIFIQVATADVPLGIVYINSLILACHVLPVKFPHCFTSCTESDLPNNFGTSLNQCFSIPTVTNQYLSRKALKGPLHTSQQLETCVFVYSIFTSIGRQRAERCLAQHVQLEDFSQQLNQLSTLMNSTLILTFQN